MVSDIALLLPHIDCKREMKNEAGKIIMIIMIMIMMIIIVIIDKLKNSLQSIFILKSS